MRLPYIEDDPQMADPDDQAVVERVKQRRGGKLLELDKALLHAPPIADGWNSFLKSIRTQNSLSDSIRELAISRVAALNQAWYEWDHHAPLLEAAGEIKKDAIDRLKHRDVTKVADSLDDEHRAVLDVTDAMTLNIIVPEKEFEELRRHFSDREVTEIVATVSAYNCVSRFLVALDVGEMAEKYGIDMSK